MTAPSSPRFSLAGWNWRVYLAKTKAGLKWVGAALVTYLAVVIAPIQPPELQALLAAVLGYGSKLLFDVIDFWLSDVPLEEEPRA